MISIKEEFEKFKKLGNDNDINCLSTQLIFDNEYHVTVRFEDVDFTNTNKNIDEAYTNIYSQAQEYYSNLKQYNFPIRYIDAEKVKDIIQVNVMLKNKSRLLIDLDLNFKIADIYKEFDDDEARNYIEWLNQINIKEYLYFIRGEL